MKDTTDLIWIADYEITYEPEGMGPDPMITDQDILGDMIEMSHYWETTNVVLF
jgi:hypothetical protein